MRIFYISLQFNGVCEVVKINENFVVDKNGNRVGVFLDIEAYQKIIEELEELDDLRAFDLAKARNNEPIPFEQAVKEIEQSR
jgi:hypothetical protein